MRSLLPYQKRIISYLHENEGGALFAKMRLRKTATTIAWAKKDVNSLILVLAPYSAILGWKNDLIADKQLFATFDGSGAKRRVKFEAMLGMQGRFWFICNKEIWRTIPDILSVQWGLCIIDESTSIADPRTRISKFCLKIKADRRVILTGTPRLKNELSYFNQLYFVNPAILECKSFWEFRLRHFTLINGFKWCIKRRSKEWLFGKIAKHCMVLDYADAGVKIAEEKTIRLVQMPAKLQKAYSEMERVYWMQLDGQSYRTKHAVAKYSMLRKLASGILDDAIISEHKIAELIYLLDNEFADEQVIIWCNHLIEGMHVAFKLNIPFVYGEMPLQKREVHFGEFVSGKLQHILIQPETQKFGRNLSNADVNIFLSSPTSSMTREQSQSRFISIDKMRTLYTIDIVAEGTVDHDIAKAHIKNKNAEKEMFNAIRLRNNRSRNKRGDSTLAR